MGGAASIQSVVAKAAFQKYRAAYDDLSAKNASDEDIAVFIRNSAQEFTKLVSDTSESGDMSQSRKPGVASTTSLHRPSQKGLQKGFRSAKSGSQKRSTGRRRSYGEDSMKKLTTVASQKASPVVVESQSEAQLDTINAELNSQLEQMKAMNAETSPTKPENAGETMKDSWESVRQLPYCQVCQMAFKTLSALDRHTKYSTLHATSLDAMKKKEEQEKKPKFEIQQEEGKDFRLLYYGSKFFWRTQDNIDISFYLHMALSVIEVVPYNVYKNKELDRIYLDKYMIDTAIEEEVREEMEAKRQILEEQKKADKFGGAVEWDEAVEYSTFQRIKATTQILSRLQLNNVMAEGSTKGIERLQFVPVSSDDPAILPLLNEIPELLVPVKVTHRRNTSEQEIKSKLKEVEDGQKSLKLAIGKAEKVTTHVHTFLQVKEQTRALQKLPPGLRRFIKAVRKVIQQLAVVRTKEHLASFEKKKESPKRRQRGVSMLIKSEV